MKKTHSHSKGFTLAELLVVVAIIGILVAISIPIFNKQTEKSREATDVANLRSAYSAALYAGMMGEFTTVDGNGENPVTWTWDGKGYVHKKGDDNGYTAQRFFYDTDSGQFIHGHVGYSSTYKYLKPCGLGTKVDGGTKAIFFGRGEYRGNVDFRNSYINIYFEDDGAVSVYFGDLDGNAVIQH